MYIEKMRFFTAQDNLSIQTIGYKNSQFIKYLLNEIISWFTKRRRCKCIRLRNKNKKLIRKLQRSENETKISQNKVIELVDEIKQLTDTNSKLEIENQELKEQKKNKTCSSQKAFILKPTYVSL